MNEWVYEVDLPMGALVKRHLQLTTSWVTFNGKSMAVADIWSISIQVTRHFTNGIPTQTTYLVKLGDANGRDFKLNWSFGSLQKKATKELCGQAYRTLIDMLADQAGPRIIGWLINQPMPFKLGPLEFSADGIDVSGLLSAKRAPWPSITRVAMEQGNYNVFYVNENGKEARLATMSLMLPNAVFLPELVSGVRARVLAQ